jgi:hypothetical protein
MEAAKEKHSNQVRMVRYWEVGVGAHGRNKRYAWYNSDGSRSLGLIGVAANGRNTRHVRYNFDGSRIVG